MGHFVRKENLKLVCLPHALGFPQISSHVVDYQHQSNTHRCNQYLTICFLHYLAFTLIRFLLPLLHARLVVHRNDAFPSHSWGLSRSFPLAVLANCYPSYQPVVPTSGAAWSTREDIYLQGDSFFPSFALSDCIPFAFAIAFQLFPFARSLNISTFVSPSSVALFPSSLPW